MTISYEVAEPVATITMHREEKLNALDYAMIDDLQRLLDVVAADDRIRAVLLTGAGDRAFSASLGFPPPFGGSQRLPRHVGRKRVAEGLARFLDRRPAASTESAATPGDRS